MRENAKRMTVCRGRYVNDAQSYKLRMPRSCSHTRDLTVIIFNNGFFLLQYCIGYNFKINITMCERIDYDHKSSFWSLELNQYETLIKRKRKQPILEAKFFFFFLRKQAYFLGADVISDFRGMRCARESARENGVARVQNAPTSIHLRERNSLQLKSDYVLAWISYGCKFMLKQFRKYILGFSLLLSSKS